jgi:hypothetical protein
VLVFVELLLESFPLSATDVLPLFATEVLPLSATLVLVDESCVELSLPDDATDVLVELLLRSLPESAMPTLVELFELSFPLSDTAVFPLSETAVLPESATDVLFELEVVAFDPPAAAVLPALAVLSGVAAGAGDGVGVGSAIAGIAIAVMNAAMAVPVRSLFISLSSFCVDEQDRGL